MNVPVRLLCMLGICFFGSLAEGKAKGTGMTEEEISEQMEEVFSTYYYTNLDSALYHFGEIAETAKRQEMWLTYLDVVTKMAWCADHHKNIDTLAYFLAKGEKSAS